MKVIITDKQYSPKLCAEHPGWLFVFGDNLKRKGKSGQACIRDCENAIGLATKEAPNTYNWDYFSDNKLSYYMARIENDIRAIIKYYDDNFHAIAFPRAGLGTGLAKLKEKAPLVWYFLCEQLKEHFGFNNENGELYENT